MKGRTELMTEVDMAKKVKIRFPLDPKEGQGYEIENLWAEPVESDEFRILNSPFFAFGVSADDIVRAETRDGSRTFREVSRRGGHSTYRVFLQGGRTIHDEEFQALWAELRSLRCTFENANDKFVSIDVPPGTGVTLVYTILKRGEASGVWAFEEAHYAGDQAR